VVFVVVNMAPDPNASSSGTVPSKDPKKKKDEKKEEDLVGSVLWIQLFCAFLGFCAIFGEKAK
jgi:hypothetical protein